MLPTISRRIFQTFRCQTYDNGDVRLLEMDLEIECTSPEYKLMLFYAIIMCLVYPIGVWSTLLAVSHTVVPTPPVLRPQPPSAPVDGAIRRPHAS